MKVRSYWIRKGPKSNVTNVFIRRGEDAESYTEGRGHVNMEEETAATSQEVPRIAGSHQKLEEARSDLP